MIIAYVAIGTAIGIFAAAAAYLAGCSIWMIVLIYSLSGSAGMLVSALIIHGIIRIRPGSPKFDATAPSRRTSVKTVNEQVS